MSDLDQTVPDLSMHDYTFQLTAWKLDDDDVGKIDSVIGNTLLALLAVTTYQPCQWVLLVSIIQL
ncbi:hypothetical protein MTR_8g093510 [Medicago truncatula]|uniref:Uncharacterized protein n=1 Tax=Medicago truncatula TaxID=3880 RepID=G7LE07_MEDTR|nr:hypothetical protein MTR_8g093510 [Medicago truncatula]